MSCSSLSRSFLLRSCRPGLQSGTTAVPPLLRQFHATRPNRFISEVLHTSQSIFQATHDLTGLPWAYSIPLAGALFQLCYQPLGWYIEENGKRLTTAIPLVRAWKNIFDQKSLDAINNVPPGQVLDPAAVVQVRLLAKTHQRTKIAELKEKYHFRSPRVSLLSVLYLPVWVTNFRVVGWMAGQNAIVQGAQSPEAGQVPAIITPEPSFAVEGLSWCVDLTVADPLWVLPCIQWAVFAYAISHKMASKNQPSTASPSLQTSVLDRILIVAAIMIGPVLIFSQVPSAVVLYMIGSSITAQVGRQCVQWIVGKTTPIPAAVPRRPRMKIGPRL